jgi:alkylhydroperoxidase family enzyme
MARVPLIQPNDRPELAALVSKISGSRGGRLLNIYRTLLHSPDVTEPWLNFLSALRFNTRLDGASIELAIIRVGIVNKTEYILRQHIPDYALQNGLTLEQTSALAAWESSKLFDDRQRALLAYVDAMTREIEVSDDVFSTLQSHYSAQQIVEVTVLVGAYNMHSRVVRALRIDLEQPKT